jgi:hypothetical protein
MRRAALLLAFPALIAAAPVRAQDAPAAREYAVWSALLDWVLAGPPATRIVVGNSTREGDRRRAAGPFEERVLMRWPPGGGPVPGDVMQSFREANAKTWPLENRFHARVPVQLSSQAGAQVVPKEDDDEAWMNMHDGGYRGSHGIAALSRVGFGADGRTALVYLGVYCGGLCGEEAYYLLALKADERWTVVRKYVTSQS